MVGWIEIRMRVGGTFSALAVLLGVSLPAVGQQPLNENCTVSILNRNASVAADGTWRIVAVPAGRLGRVSATCLNNGQTPAGHSDLFSVVASRTSGILLFGISPAQPIPEGLAITSLSRSATSDAAGQYRFDKCPGVEHLWHVDV